MLYLIINRLPLRRATKLTIAFLTLLALEIVLFSYIFPMIANSIIERPTLPG